ncbi:hypothetical protein FPQ18DRAFT_309255 [Pyronema domesticum]|nr:hypothetical protein FPQ18DRAFT_309255 [Pyronema domesticum]
MAKIGALETDATVDTQFLGITPLYRGADPSIDIVAVPGLRSHAFDTWKSQYGFKMWLRDFLPKDKALQNTRIVLFGYRSDLKDNSSLDSVQKYARRFLIHLQHCRPEIKENRRPIIFICHCFGGHLVKKALTDAALAKTSEPDQAISMSSAALLFFGVPNRGMDNSDLRKLVGNQNNSQLVVQDLAVSAPNLRVIHQHFDLVFENIPGCRVVSFYEALGSKAMEEAENGTWKRTGQILRSVTMESATYAVPNEESHNQIPLDSDHSNIVKCDHSSDGGFIIVITKLKEYTFPYNTGYSTKAPSDQLHLMVPFPRNEDFIGESHVESWFKAHRKKRIEAEKSQHTGHLRLALCGLGGDQICSQKLDIEKTQDVFSFIYKYENQRPVFWVHAQSVTQFEADYRKLGSLAKIPGHNDTKQSIGLIVKQWLGNPQSGD